MWSAPGSRVKPRKERNVEKKIYVGGVAVGGDAPVSVQSMTKTDTRDAQATIAQVRELDRLAMEQCGIAGSILMERVGGAAYTLLRQRWPQVRQFRWSPTESAIRWSEEA